MPDNYSRQTVEWVLEHLLELRQGIWPDPESGESYPTGHSRQPHAPFETPAGMAGVVEQKLKATGLVGLMTKIHFVMGESDRDLAAIARCPVGAIPGRIDKVLRYISGKPKGRSYQEFRRH